MKKIIKAIIAIPLLVAIFFSLFGCEDFTIYTGPLDLCNQAGNNIVGIREVVGDPCVIIEEDSYGRTLFLYIGGSIIAAEAEGGSETFIAILVCQKSDDDYVYFYPDINFTLESYESSTSIFRLCEEEQVRIALAAVTHKAIDQLKELNDWDKPINDDRCTRVEIQTHNGFPATQLIQRSVLEEAYGTVALRNEYYVSTAFYYLSSDSYGRHIFFFRTDNEDGIYVNSYVVIFNPDRSYVIEEIKDIWNYQYEMMDFKAQNNWDKPL
jgi:hypothetical protein